MNSLSKDHADAEVIQLRDVALDVDASPPPPPPPPPPVPQMPSTGRMHRANHAETAVASELVVEARAVLEAACKQVDDMIGSARSIIAKAEDEAKAIIDEARVTAQRITGDARTQAASIDRPTIPALDGADPPAPQQKSFAAMWARAGEEADAIDDLSADDFFVSAERKTASDLAKRLSPRWRQG